VQTGAKQVQETTKHVEEGMAIVRYLLLAFGAIALFVGAFVIFNTLSVTVAQRTRELATLRTLGASRLQVLGAVVLEALVIGVLASLIGLAAGLGLAKALASMFASMGMQLPNAGTVFATRTVIVSLTAGIAVTLLASVVPAIRATRVAPIAAVREGAIAAPGRFARAKSLVVTATAVVGGGVLGTGLLASGLATSARLLLLAAGAAILFVCLAFVSRWLVAPLAAALGRPFEKLTGAAGMLARENSSRNPARTAVTAGALTVGVALVAFVATLGAGLRGTLNESVKRQISADYVISADNAPLSPAVGDALRARPGVAVSSVREGQIIAFGKSDQINGVDPSTISRFYRFTWTPGSGPGAAALLSQSGEIVSKPFAATHHLTIGSRFGVETQSGAKLTLTVRGIQTLPTFGALLGAVTISTTLFDHSFAQPTDAAILARTSGATPAAQQSLTNVVAGFPSAEVRTISAYIKTTQSSINTLLNLFYVLLALSVIVSLFGIVNTLALSIVERTREIGALRAIGMTRRQLTRMIRIESEITALIGAVIGIVVGLALAGLATAGLASWNLSLSVPWTTLLVLAIAAFFAGMAAGVFPARRAAHLDPLQALQYE
jgi:putative ABC transport system permease protein